MSPRTATEGHTVIVSAPYGRDAESVANLLDGMGYRTAICRAIGDVSAALGDDAGVVLITEEALNGNTDPLEAAIKAQPAWSDIPFILLARRRDVRGRTSELLRIRLAETLSNTIVLERPLGTASLMSAIRSAMRSRQRQFEMRDRLIDLAESEQRLRNESALLDQLNRTLEAKVEERTAALESEMASRSRAEAALRQSQKMEAVGQLTGGIAHDFNNMLTGVIGAMDIMKRRLAKGRTDDLDRFMDAASTSAMRAAALTARLLAFSRRQSLDTKPLDVNLLARSLEELLRRTIGENIELHFETAANLSLATTDANQLENAVLNLAINARDAMPHGGRLTIETCMMTVDDAYVAARPDIAVGRYVVISVSDTGVGIAPDILEKVFEPFFSTKPTGQGTGLGLSMVYGFAHQSGGQVRIHSQAGEGTTVSIFLPASEETAAAGELESSGSIVDGRGQTVLLIEDDDSVRLLVRDVLEELHYQAFEVCDATSAIPILASDQHLDLMISDVGLPGMNGRQLAEVARKHRPELPILFVTGYAENAAIRAGFLGTNMAMIAKPFAIEALSAKIAEMMPV